MVTKPSQRLCIDGVTIHEVVAYRPMSRCWEVIDTQGRTLYIYPSFIDTDLAGNNKWKFTPDSIELLKQGEGGKGN